MIKHTLFDLSPTYEDGLIIRRGCSIFDEEKLHKYISPTNGITGNINDKIEFISYGDSAFFEVGEESDLDLIEKEKKP